MDSPGSLPPTSLQIHACLPPFGESFRALQNRYGHLWLAEAERCYPTDDEWDVASCAEIADELWHHKLAADSDLDFEGELLEWDIYVFQHDLRLPLEQCCHEGMLLPLDQRAMRLVSCPESMMNPLRFFFAECPTHLQSYLALYNYVAVRLDRAKRTGSPDWFPKSASPAPEEPAFFRPPLLRFRNYAR